MTTSTVKVYTAQEVAEIMRCDVETVYRWARKGRISYSRAPGVRAYRFTQKHLDDYLHGNGPATESASAPKPSRNPKYSK